MTKNVGISILGCGVVGAASAELLIARRVDYAARCGVDLNLRSIVVRDSKKRRPPTISASMLTTDMSSAIGDPETQIVIELIGGTTIAREAILGALRAGKDVVTANKALLALHGSEIFAAARNAGRCVAFEAAVGGGIPLIESIRRGLVANDIETVHGILNGTCNYILTRMSDSKVPYAVALAEAQRLGYAEADPTLDVDGTDSAHKLTIVASLAMRRACQFAKIPHRGITNIEVTDLIAGAELGFVCKLLAAVRRHDDGIDLSVQPTFISTSHPLASVRGPFNALSMYGDAAGHILLYGRGAGGMPTASAVISDVIDVASGNASRIFSEFDVLPDRTPPAIHRPRGDNVTACYLRVGLKDKPGGMASVAKALGDQGINIASLVQHQAHATHSQDAVPVVVVTHPTREANIDAAILVINALDVVISPAVRIPILDDHADVSDIHSAG